MHMSLPSGVRFLGSNDHKGPHPHISLFCRLRSVCVCACGRPEGTLLQETNRVHDVTTQSTYPVVVDVSAQVLMKDAAVSR